MNDYGTHTEADAALSAGFDAALCGCGCGQLAPIRQRSNRRLGEVAGEPARFIQGHHHRVRPDTTVERFWAQIEKSENGCWLWTGTLTPRGYAQLHRSGRRHVYAHRFSYELHVGRISPGLHVDHRCHNADPSCPGGDNCPHRRCVRPDHLEAVTPKENNRRMRARRGGATA